LKIKDIKLGQKLWSIKRQKYGNVVRIGPTGWITLSIEGKRTKNWYTYLRKRRPKRDNSFKLLEELPKDQQKDVLKRSHCCNLPIHTVMVEMGLSTK